MVNDILSILHNSLTLLFGIYISAAFLGVHLNRRNILILLCFFVSTGTVYALSFVLYGATFTTQIYPLIIHLPLILLLSYYYKYGILRSAFSVSTAYLCCQISKWIGLVAKDISQQEWVYYTARIITTILIFILLIRYVATAAAQLIQKSRSSILIFALMPFTYYLFDYATGVYTSLLYSGKEVVAEFLGFTLCITYLLFLVIYFEQYEEKCEVEHKARMLELQRAQSQKEIDANKRSEYAISLLRHDMRHFLANISVFIDNCEYDKAKEYINGINSYTDQTAMHKFCCNKIINMILSSYENEINEAQIDFKYSIQVPEQLFVSDIDLTSILSNAMENAIHAVLLLPLEKRHIALKIDMNDDKLLISIKNTFAQKPELTDGIPRANKSGHGFGTQSIRYVTEKLNGNYQFSIKDDMFILRVIL